MSMFRFWLLSLTFASLTMLTFANTVQIYLSVPIALLFEKDICDYKFQDLAETLLIIGYFGPLLYGLIIVFLMNYFAADGSNPGESSSGKGPYGADTSSNTMSKFQSDL